MCARSRPVGCNRRPTYENAHTRTHTKCSGGRLTSLASTIDGSAIDSSIAGRHRPGEGQAFRRNNSALPIVTRPTKESGLWSVQIGRCTIWTMQALEVGDSCRRQWVIHALLPVRDNLKPLENREQHRHRGPCTAIAARNGDATAVTLNQILDQSKSDSET